MAVVCDWLGGFCGTDIHSGKSWNRGSELESCDGDPYLCCPGDGVGDGISDTCRKRACKYWKEELAVSDSVGALYRCFMALLLPGASGRGSLEGRTGRQDEHRADVDSGVYLPA